MSLGVLIVLLAIGVTLGFGGYLYTRSPEQADRQDHGDVILEFARAYPTEAVRSITMTRDGQTCFLRLADGKAGFLQSMGRHSVARLILPGAVSVDALDGQPGFRLSFHDSSLAGGDYIFNSTEDAAEVSLWLCGSFALASPKFDGPGGDQES